MSLRSLLFFIGLCLVSVSTVEGQSSLTAFPLQAGDSTVLAFYNTSAQAPNSRFYFAANLQGQNVNIDPTQYDFDPAGSTGYSSTGYWYTGSKIFSIPVCYNDTASYSMFINVSPFANEFQLLYYADTDGQAVVGIDSTGIDYGFCGAGSGGGGGLESITAYNLLTKVGTDSVKAGGFAVENTDFNMGAFDFRFLNSSGNWRFRPTQISSQFASGINNLSTSQSASLYTINAFDTDSSNTTFDISKTRLRLLANNNSTSSISNGIVVEYPNITFPDTLQTIYPTARYWGNGLWKFKNVPTSYLNGLAPTLDVTHEGGFIYNYFTDKFNYWDGSQFVELASSQEVADTATQLRTEFTYNFRNLDALQNTSLVLEVGDRVKIDDTGAEYLIQADSVAGYVVDSVAVVPVGSSYAVLQSKPYLKLTNFGAISGVSSVNKEVNKNAFSKALSYAKQKNEILFIDGVFVMDAGIETDYLQIKGFGLDESRLVSTGDLSDPFLSITSKENNVIIENIGISSNTGSNALNAHGVVFDFTTGGTSNSVRLENVKFLGFTGYAVYLQGNNTYLQNATFKNLFFAYVGGAIGQSTDRGSSNWWANIVTLDNITVEAISGNTIKPTSPQEYIIDLNGFRSVNIRNMLIQGAIQDTATSNQVTAALRIGGGFNDNSSVDYYNEPGVNIIGFWDEFSLNPPMYGIYVEKGMSNIDIGLARFSSLKIPYSGTSVNIDEWDQFLIDNIEIDSNSIVNIRTLIHKGFSSGDAQSTKLTEGYLNEKIVINNSVITNARAGNVNLNSYTNFSVNSIIKSVIKPIQITKNKKISILSLNGKFISTDPEEGKVFKFIAPLGLSSFPIRFNVDSSMVGKNVVISARLKIETDDTNSRFSFTPALSNGVIRSSTWGTNYTVSLPEDTSVTVKNKWQTVYLIAKPTQTGTISLNSSWLWADTTHTFLIGDININIGNELSFPSRGEDISIPNSYEVEELAKNYYSSGDIVTQSGVPYICTQSGYYIGQEWEPLTSYSQYTFIKTSNNRVYMVTSGGVSSNTEPTLENYNVVDSTLLLAYVGTGIATLVPFNKIDSTNHKYTYSFTDTDYNLATYIANNPHKTEINITIGVSVGGASSNSILTLPTPAASLAGTVVRVKVYDENATHDAVIGGGGTNTIVNTSNTLSDNITAADGDVYTLVIQENPNNSTYYWTQY